jgi:hypothetical protein
MVVSKTPNRTYCDTLDLVTINSLYVTSTTNLKKEMDICTYYTTVSSTINQEH